jgi:hypothetical protein
MNRVYPAQESAIPEWFEDRNVILNTPTGVPRHDEKVKLTIVGNPTNLNRCQD